MSRTKPKVLHEIYEQDAIFDGKPDFMPGSLIINTLNHYSLGGHTLADAKEHLEDGAERPTRYKVRVIMEYEEYLEQVTPNA